MKTYDVCLNADGGHKVHYYVYCETPEIAKELACKSQLAPMCAVAYVKESDFES